MRRLGQEVEVDPSITKAFSSQKVTEDTASQVPVLTKLLRYEHSQTVEYYRTSPHAIGVEEDSDARNRWHVLQYDKLIVESNVGIFALQSHLWACCRLIAAAQRTSAQAVEHTAG